MIRLSHDIIGRRFGMLVVKDEAEPVTDARGHRVQRFSCLCDCGTEKVFRYNNLMSGLTNSCGCTRFPRKPPVDLTGRKFGRYTVLSEAEPHIQKCGKSMRSWNCVCECGTEKVILQSNLVSPHGVRSCGCALGKQYTPRKESLNLVGNRYGKLTVLAQADPLVRKNGACKQAWRCRCDCRSEVVIAQDNLLSGHTRSCGCLRGHGFQRKKFGKLTALSRADTSGSMRYWNCRCDCGNELVVCQDDLYWGSVTDCGCISRSKPRVDISGQTFGLLTAIREADPIISSKGKPERAWLCRCECGREVVIRQHNLTNHVTRSCGCLRSAKQWQRVRKNG